jgi:hypothetical protein
VFVNRISRLNLAHEGNTRFCSELGGALGYGHDSMSGWPTGVNVSHALLLLIIFTQSKKGDRMIASKKTYRLTFLASVLALSFGTVQAQGGMESGPGMQGSQNTQATCRKLARPVPVKFQEPTNRGLARKAVTQAPQVPAAIKGLSKARQISRLPLPRRST